MMKTNKNEDKKRVKNSQFHRQDLSPTGKNEVALVVLCREEVQKYEDEHICRRQFQLLQNN